MPPPPSHDTQGLLDFAGTSPRPTPPTYPPPAFADHTPRPLTDTQLAAYRTITPRAASLRDKVLDFIVSRGAHGATDQECQAALDLPAQTQGPRRIELARAGLVRDSGQRRLTPSGRRAIVWISAESGPAALSADSGRAHVRHNRGAVRNGQETEY